MLLFTEAVPPGSAFYIPEERHAEVLEASWGSRTTVVYQYYNPVTVVCTSWTRHAIRGGVVRRSCSGPFNQSWRSHAEVVSCDRYTKYYKSHGAVCLFRSRRRHGVHGAPCDWGIRKKYSTFLALMDLVDNISKNIDEGNYSIGIFLDLSKAFDTIDHTILLDKWCRYGVRGVTLNWFKHYLNDRKQFVSYNNTTSVSMKVTCGVPQGSILGPLLFICT